MFSGDIEVEYGLSRKFPKVKDKAIKEHQQILCIMLNELRNQ